MIGKIGLLIRSKRVFLATVVAISTLKLLLSALVPASYDLRDIVNLFYQPKAPLGPWVPLYPPLYLPWIPREAINTWLVAQPITNSIDVLVLSLLFRLPIFAFDIATLCMVYYTGTKLGTPEMARLASLIWYLNPYSLLSVELVGVPDVVVAFLITSAVCFTISRRLLPAAAVIALGIFFKFIPLVLAFPIFLAISTRTFSRKRFALAAGITLVGLVGYLGWVLPSGLAFLTDYSPVTQPIPFIIGPPIVMGVSYSYTINEATFGMISFYCLLVFFAKRDALIPISLSTLMAYYLFANYLLASLHPQYFIWALPLIALDLVFVSRSRAILATAFYALAFVYWFLVSYSFLTPSGYSLFMIPLSASNPPSYVLQLRSFFENNQLLNVIILPLVFSSLFASTLIYAIDAARSWFALPTSKPA